MGNQKSLSHRLIKIASLYKKGDNRLSKKVLEEIKDLQKSKLLDYKLSRSETLIMAYIWHDVVTGGYQHFDPMDLMLKIFGNPYTVINNLDALCNLVNHGILDSEKKKIISNNIDNEVHVTVEKEKLVKSNIFLSDRFLRKLISPKKQDTVENSPYSSNKEFINDWFNYIDALRELSLMRFSPVIYEEEDYGEELYNVAVRRKIIDSRLALTEKKFPLQTISEEYGLDHKEQIILIYLIQQEIQGRRCETGDVLEMISKDRFEVHQNKLYLMPDSRLISNGIVEMTELRGFQILDEIRVSQDIAMLLMGQDSIEESIRIKDVLRGNPLLEYEYPPQRMEDLILEEKLKETLLKSLARYQNHVSAILRKWKVLDERFGSGESLTILLSGLPGTGKTFCAWTVANYLRKPLLYTDISRILSAWVGESEKNVRSLFTSYDRIARQLKDYPVLLLNEADQFLTRRGIAEKSVDRMYNQMQNLFLEAFEKFRGILICTTNLRDNLDPAFSRRFHLKLVFPLPGYEERVKLWKLHLPEIIPGVEDINVNELARKYELSGGQIAIIVKNAATEAAGRKEGEQRLLQNDLEHFCCLELNSSFEKSKVKFGF